MIEKAKGFNNPNYNNYKNERDQSPYKPSRAYEQTVKKETLEKLNNLIKSFALKLKKENINVTDDCRIDMNSFSNIYTDIENDKRYIDAMKSKFSNMNNIGEPVEILTTII